MIERRTQFESVFQLSNLPGFLGKQLLPFSYGEISALVRRILLFDQIQKFVKSTLTRLTGAVPELVDLFHA